jgi:ubiquinone/menaquinone biosynthesis C-methylase UbiE
MKVLDLGCGSGAFTTFAARAVRANGKVYAVDIQPKMLDQLRKKLRRPEFQDIKNIEIKQASAHELPLENESIDLAYMVTVLPEIPDPGKALQEVKRVLKPGGILAITEFFPDPDYPLRSTTVRTGQEQGFVLEASMGSFWNYTVRFRKPVQQD